MRGKFSHMGKRVLSLLLIFLISLIGFDLLAINGSITAVSEGTIFEPSFSIYPLPSYKEYLNRHGTVKNVTISEYNSKYGTASQYGSDYKIRIDNAEQLFLFSKLSNDLATRHHF